MLKDIQDSATTAETDAEVPYVEPRTATPMPNPATGKKGEPAGEKPRIVEEVVIEEVSIDGMCGVY